MGQKRAQKGPGGLPKGPGRHFVSFGQSFSPNGPIWGPFGPLFVFQFPPNPFWAQIAPTPQSQTRFWGPGTQVGGSVRPLEAEGRLFGGPGAEPPGISPILAYFVRHQYVQNFSGCDVTGQTFQQLEVALGLCMWTESSHPQAAGSYAYDKVQISLFFCDSFRFSLFLLLFLDQKWTQKGPGGLLWSGEAFRFIWTKFQPKWAYLGPIRVPFCFSISPKPILGPNSSKSIIPNEVLGPWDLGWDPGWGEPAAPGGRRPTFRRGATWDFTAL